MNTIDTTTFARLLAAVEKPGRYTGNELNAVRKPDAFLRVGISYPDLYEVGMSNNGVRILYDAVNRIEEFACERVFAVPADFEERLRALALPLFTLESRIPLSRLDMLGFNLSHELVYTNVLQILDLGGIPLLARERGQGDPIVVAGGEAASNPAPMLAFFDAFFAGDGEEGIVDIARALAEGKRKGLRREEVLASLGEVLGVLVSSAYAFEYSGGKLSGVSGPSVAKRVYRSAAPAIPEKPLVPSIRIAQERAIVDVTRGCCNLCKFCHAGYYELPYRRYGLDEVKKGVYASIGSTGYNELSLSSLSVSDYPDLVPLLNAIFPDLTRMGVSISLPSLRVDRNTIAILELTSDVRRSSLTFAVESASEAMRARAHKRLVIDDLVEIVEFVIDRGWKHIKLYFMLGLPGCEEHDEAQDIIDLLKRIHHAGRRRLSINVTLSPFIPKSHTPFQRERQMDEQYCADAVFRIKRGVPRSVTIKSHDLHASIVEGAFARGDTRLGEAVLRAYRGGCRLDSWSEHFRFDIWQNALDETVPGWREYLARREDGDILPWKMVTTGFDRLVEIKERSTKCAMRRPSSANRRQALDADAMKAAFADFTAKYQVNGRVRMRFAKRGDARYISHIDFVDVLKRAFRMAGIPVSLTQGFNKRERLAPGYPLPLGIESEAELCDADLFAPVDIDEAKKALSGKLPEGIFLRDLRPLEGHEAGSIMSLTAAMSFDVATGDDGLRSRLADGLAAKAALTKKTKSGEKAISFDEAVISSTPVENGMRIMLSVGSEQSIRIDELVSILSGAPPGELWKFSIVKTAQFSRSGGGFSELR